MTDDDKALLTISANKIVLPTRVTFFDGDSIISLHRDGKLELGSAWADAGDAAAAFFDALVNKVVPSWNARADAYAKRISELEAILREVTPPAHFGESEQNKAWWAKARAALGETE